MKSLDEKEWGEFRIAELFSVSRPNARNKDAYESGDIPFVASGGINNGVMKCCAPKDGERLDDGGCITVSPVAGSAFYQPTNFLGRGGAGSSILILRRDGETQGTGVFIARAIQQTCSKYTYGHMGKKDSISRERIMLPVTNFGNPDYDYMAEYSKQKWESLLARYYAYVEAQITELGEAVDILALDKKEWRPIKLSSIGKISSGCDVYAKIRVEGTTPYITSGSQNNGIGFFVANVNETLDCNYIAINRNGAVGKAFYHSYKSLMGNDCRKLHLMNYEDNKFAGIFIATVISKQSECFSYSRKLGTERASQLKIMLPVTDSGKPDYTYMEQYVKNMMIRKYRQYLSFLEGKKCQIGASRRTK